MGKVEVAGVQFEARPTELPYVPPVDKNYVFGKHSFDVALDLVEDKAPLLTGHAGTGKTSCPQQIAARIGQPVITINCGNQMSFADFVGYMMVKAGETVWVDGALPYAMKNGFWLGIEEVDCADAQVLAALNTVLQPITASSPRRMLTIKEKGHEILTAHENFRIFATANGVGAMARYRHLYPGTNALNEAFLDRFRIYLVDYLEKEQEVDVLMGTYEFKEELRPLIARLVDIAILVREAFKKEDVTHNFSMRRLFDWCAQIKRHSKRPGQPLERVLYAADSTIFSRVSPEEAEIIKGIITRVLG